MRVAAYFWLVSAGLGWVRSSLALFEEAFGDRAPWLFQSSVVRLERRKTYMHLGTGEFGVLRGKTGVM